jgi:hypothetical protein
VGKDTHMAPECAKEGCLWARSVQCPVVTLRGASWVGIVSQVVGCILGEQVVGVFLYGCGCASHSPTVNCSRNLLQF